MPISQLYTALRVLYIDRGENKIFSMRYVNWQINYIFSVILSRPVKKSGTREITVFSSAIQIHKLKTENWCYFSELIIQQCTVLALNPSKFTYPTVKSNIHLTLYPKQ
jgi:hypothetical protein